VERAKVIFGPLQVGVATQGGAEASVHAVRKLAEEFGNDPGKIMLKVDFSNAFNLVDRTVMLAQVYDKLPGLYRWVEYCYSHPAHLFFGTSILSSAAGVQQGDPLGPLLFSLVLHPLACKIEAEFPELDLCVWYLDDGTIIGQVDDVHQVFLLIERDGPALGLHLNVKKNEIWWPNRASPDPFPAEVDRVDNAGVKLLGAPIGTKDFTTNFVKKKLEALTTPKLSSPCFEVVCPTTRSTTCCAPAHRIYFRSLVQFWRPLPQHADRNLASAGPLGGAMGPGVPPSEICWLGCESNQGHRGVGIPWVVYFDENRGGCDACDRKV